MAEVSGRESEIIVCEVQKDLPLFIGPQLCLLKWGCLLFYMSIWTFVKVWSLESGSHGGSRLARLALAVRKGWACQEDEARIRTWAA
jgi:hypothetical protein